MRGPPLYNAGMTSHETSIAVIGGTGHEGRGIALRFARAGVRVCVGSRDGARAAASAAELSARIAPLQLSGSDNGSAIRDATVVILSVPFLHAADTVAQHREAFRPGTLLLDVTVPLVFEGGKPRLVPPPEGSAAEHLRPLLPDHVQLACAFKTIPARLLEHLDEPLDCDEFVCGDSKEVRDRAIAVLQQIPGLRAVDAGPLEAARALEHMTWLAILLNKRYKSHNGRFKVLGV